MARSFSELKDENLTRFNIETIDEEIAILLIAIEEEKVPARLQELALKLQTALAGRRAREVASS